MPVCSKFFPLAGKVALITGASSGLGEHFAKLLASLGARVALVARRADPLARLAAQLKEEGAHAAPFVLDLGDGAAIAPVFSQIEHDFGPIDILVNNAGIAIPGHALTASIEDWDKVLNVNLRAVFLASQATAKLMRAGQRGGVIINIASLAASRPVPGLASYAAAKAGVAQLTRSLALEWARFDIRVNAIAPGYIVTDLNQEFLNSPSGKKLCERIPQRRFGKPEDLDGALALLAGPGSAWMTGTMIAVDGGHELV